MTDDKSQTAETPDDDPRGGDDYADEWQDLSEKDILIGCLTELQQIRMLLSQGAQEPSDDDGGEPTYRCTACHETMPASKREQHARKQHNSLEGYGMRLFEVVE